MIKEAMKDTNELKEKDLVEVIGGLKEDEDRPMKDDDSSDATHGPTKR